MEKVILGTVYVFAAICLVGIVLGHPVAMAIAIGSVSIAVTIGSQT